MGATNLYLIQTDVTTGEAMKEVFTCLEYCIMLLKQNNLNKKNIEQFTEILEVSRFLYSDN